MATIRDVRRASMPVIAVLALLIVGCVVYIFSPAGRSRLAREREYRDLQAEVTAKRQDVLPTRGMDNKLKQASGDIDSFYGSRFPDEYSTVAEELGKVAGENGVHLNAVKYDDKDAVIEGLRKLTVDITLSGDYLQEVKFINALERDKIFFLVDGVSLGEQQGNVRLQLKLETYLRSGVVPS
jgi:cbb3-type cytochrome oxidase subunit 3